MTDYKWAAESIVMASPALGRDVAAAITHALDVPGTITPARADRLKKLRDKLEIILAGGA